MQRQSRIIEFEVMLECSQKPTDRDLVLSSNWAGREDPSINGDNGEHLGCHPLARRECSAVGEDPGHGAAVGRDEGERGDGQGAGE